MALAHRTRSHHPRGEDGATAVEYALITAAIASLIILVVIVVGQQTKETFCSGSSALEATGAQENPNCP